LSTLVRRTVELRGVAGAARALGVSRTVVLAVMANHPVLPGSLALLREAFRRSDLAREAGPASRAFPDEVA
jgi:hypothetical protein